MAFSPVQAVSHQPFSREPSGERPLVAQAAARLVNVTFLSLLMKAMRQTVSERGLLTGGRGGEVFRAQLDTVLIDQMSERLETPLAAAIVRQVSPGSSRRPSTEGWNG